MPSPSRFVSSVSLLVIVASLLCRDAAWAASEAAMPVRIEVFTAGDLPIQPPVSDGVPLPTPIEVYEIDAIASLESALSKKLPADPDGAQRLVRKRLGQVVDRSRLEHARRSATGVLNAAEYGIDRYPAVVFDGDAVVYGVTDLGEALRHYRKWKGGRRL
jgi:integrating conjugative element protein (TIGR03757 family)